MWAGAQELRGSLQLQLSTLASILSIAAFNFFGISVTKNLSGAARATIDACRTLFVWAFSLGIGWERFHALEVGCFRLGKLSESGLAWPPEAVQTPCKCHCSVPSRTMPCGKLDNCLFKVARA